MQRVLVTGGAGFIGSHLCKSLLDDNYQVTCVDNLITGSKKNIEELLNNPKDVKQKIQSMLDENDALKKQIEVFTNEKAQIIKQQLLQKVKLKNGINVIAEKIELSNADAIKNISFEMRSQLDDAFILLGAESDGKALLSLIISDNLVKEKNLNASNIIREISKEVQGGGGGQPFYATAGGKNVDGILSALKKGEEKIY